MKRNSRPQAIDNNPDRYSHACQLGPLTMEEGGSLAGWLLLNLRWLGVGQGKDRPTHLGTAAGPMFGTLPLNGPDLLDPLLALTHTHTRDHSPTTSVLGQQGAVLASESRCQRPGSKNEQAFKRAVAITCSAAAGTNLP